MNKQLSLFVIIASSLITLMTSDIFLPSMPQIAEYFFVDSSSAQLSISFFLGGQILATLLWGTLSDNIGRKKAFSIGMYLFFMGTIICILSASIYIFFIREGNTRYWGCCCARRRLGPYTRLVP